MPCAEGEIYLQQDRTPQAPDGHVCKGGCGEEKDKEEEDEEEEDEEEEDEEEEDEEEEDEEEEGGGDETT